MNRIIVRFAVLALFLIAVPVTAQMGWTSVGSTGAVDEGSQGLYQATLQWMQFQAAATGIIIARYNVTNTYGGLTQTPPWDTLAMGYLDDSPSGLVNATLYQVNLCTGAMTTLCSVSSIDASHFTCKTCSFPSGSIDFAANFYFVEARISRGGTSVNPLLTMLRVF